MSELEGDRAHNIVRVWHGGNEVIEAAKQAEEKPIGHRRRPFRQVVPVQSSRTVRMIESSTRAV